MEHSSKLPAPSSADPAQGEALFTPDSKGSHATEDTLANDSYPLAARFVLFSAISRQCPPAPVPWTPAPPHDSREEKPQELAPVLPPIAAPIGCLFLFFVLLSFVVSLLVVVVVVVGT